MTSQSTQKFVARATIAELMQFGGVGVRRQLVMLTRDRLKDLTVELIGLFAVLYPGGAPAACRWWRRYAETGSVPDDESQPSHQETTDA